MFSENMCAGTVGATLNLPLFCLFSEVEFGEPTPCNPPAECNPPLSDSMMLLGR